MHKELCMRDCMNNKNRFFKTIVLFFVFCIAVFSVSAQSFEERVIVSPQEGVWANCQSLVLDLPEGYNAYYSYLSSDPLVSGFAYDGPVIIEADGDISLALVITSPEGKAFKTKIDYRVDRFLSENISQDFYANPCVSLTSGEKLSLSPLVTYAIGKNEMPYITGQDIVFVGDNPYTRYLPITLSDAGYLYRFVITMNESLSLAETFKKTSLPFAMTFENWNTVEFVIPEEYEVYLFQEGWFSGTKTVKIDRTKTQLISWREITDVDLLCYNFSLPAKPELLQRQKMLGGNNPIEIILTDDRFVMKSEKTSSDVYFRTCELDTIYGDDYSDRVSFDVYYEGMYQGSLDTLVSIDKKPPKKPSFSGGSGSFYERDSLQLMISGEGEIFYSICNPKTFTEEFNDLALDNNLLFSVENMSDLQYSIFKGKPLFLPGDRSFAQLYQVYAYAKDAAGNFSDTECFMAIIDKYNYYIDSNYRPKEGQLVDGSPARPFTKLTDIRPLLEEKDFLRLHITGDFVDIASFEIMHDCEIYGNEARLVFAPDTVCSITNANVKIANLLIEQNSMVSSGSLDATTSVLQKNMIQVVNSSVYLQNTEIVSILGENGIVFKAKNSVVDFDNSGITSQSKNYCSLIATEDSVLNLARSRFVAIAPSAVNFSVLGGKFDMTQSLCTVVAKLGRVAELSQTKYSLTENYFVHQYSDNDSETGVSSLLEPIWVDEKSTVLQYSENTGRGFKL